MLDPNFAYLAAAIELAGCLAYARDTVHGRTKPNRVSWLLWAIAPFIGFFAQIGEGVGAVAALTFVIGFGPLIVFLASFYNRKSYWRVTLLDILCGAVSVTALIFWIMTGTGLLALALSVLAEGMAAIPTIVKAYRYPKTESSLTYFAGVMSAVIALMTISSWSFASTAFSIYLLLECALIFCLIQRPKLRMMMNQVRA